MTGKYQEFLTALRQAQDERRPGDFSSEWGDGEFSAELLIRRADSTDVIPAEAGMTFRARHYWFGLDPA